MIDNLEYEISEFLNKQPNMILEREETSYIIKGRYICTLDSRGYIVNINKKIKIIIKSTVLKISIFFILCLILSIKSSLNCFN